MTINIDDLKKKIIYRSTYRGTKEMDNLLGSFSKKYIQLYEQITGQNFKAPNIDEPIRERIYKNLKTVFPKYFS